MTGCIEGRGTHGVAILAPPRYQRPVEPTWNALSCQVQLARPLLRARVRVFLYWDQRQGPGAARSPIGGSVFHRRRPRPGVDAHRPRRGRPRATGIPPRATAAGDRRPATGASGPAAGDPATGGQQHPTQQQRAMRPHQKRVGSGLRSIFRFGAVRKRERFSWGRLSPHHLSSISVPPADRAPPEPGCLYFLSPIAPRGLPVGVCAFCRPPLHI